MARTKSPPDPAHGSLASEADGVLQNGPISRRQRRVDHVARDLNGSFTIHAALPDQFPLARRDAGITGLPPAQLGRTGTPRIRERRRNHPDHSRLTLAPSGQASDRSRRVDGGAAGASRLPRPPPGSLSGEIRNNVASLELEAAVGAGAANERSRGPAGGTGGIVLFGGGDGGVARRDRPFAQGESAPALVDEVVDARKVLGAREQLNLQGAPAAAAAAAGGPIQQDRNLRGQAGIAQLLRLGKRRLQAGDYLDVGQGSFSVVRVHVRGILSQRRLQRFLRPGRELVQAALLGWVNS